MMNNVMLFVIMLGLFVQFAPDKMPEILRKNKELLLQFMWIVLFLMCFYGWRIREPEPSPVKAKPAPVRKMKPLSEPEPQPDDKMAPVEK